MLSCGSPFNLLTKHKSGVFNKFQLRSLAAEWKNILSHNSVDLRLSSAAVIHIPVDALAMQPRLSELQKFLSNDQASTVGILGPVGVGKTTLLKALNNEFLNSSKLEFHVVIFASVPRASGLRGLQAVVARRLGLPWHENESQENTAIRISIALKKRQFLLLLNDLCSPLELGEIGIPLPSRQNRSRVLFTTRYESVCRGMDADKVFKVDPLDSKGSLQLFKRCAGERSSHPDIIEAAKNIARECEGIALGLIAVGRAMESVMTREEWMWSLETLKHLKEELTSAEGTESSALIAQLYFSFKMLSTEQLRNCLLYSSLYPKNHSIKKEELICYWMGEGLLKEQLNIDRARSEGNELIAKLKALGLLQGGDNPDSEVMMHDLVRDLALTIIKKDEYIVQAGLELTKMPKLPSCNYTEKVSLMYNNIGALYQLPSFPHLKSMILRRNFSLERIQHDSLLFKSPSILRLLDLSHTRIKKIPTEIGNLVFLRHLDLSFTKIKVLPAGIGNLVNLVQLLLEGTTSLARIPGGIIPKLPKVLVLNLYASYGEWEVGTNHESGGTGIDSAASIEELNCLEQLGDLGITICNTLALESFTESSRLTKSTRRLFVKECEDLKYLHLSKSSFGNLQQVTISDCSALEEFIVGGCEEYSGDENNEEVTVGQKDGRLLQLEVLRLRALDRAEIIWKGVISHSECLPMLRELDISFCHELRNVSWVLQLRFLEIIRLNSCRKIEQVVEYGAAAGDLPRLRTLTLRNLPQLKCIFNQPLSFPSLEFVKVLHCPQLRSLPQRIGGDATPVFIHGEIEWWNALVWKSRKEKHPSFWYFQAAKELY